MTQLLRACDLCGRRRAVRQAGWLGQETGLDGGLANKRLKVDESEIVGRIQGKNYLPLLRIEPKPEIR
jgi:hypothetical protein